MKQYTIHCTEEQVKKALELGAPIEFETLGGSSNFDMKYTVTPTAEEMIGWLEEQGFYFYIMNDYHWREEVQYCNNWYHSKEDLGSRKEATLAAIDAALDYLVDND